MSADIALTWITDDNGNKCSVEYFGSEEAAREALASLKNCRDCVNCSYCSDCSDCSRCSRCSYCSRCSDCSDCSRCSRCSRCSYCSDCSDCSYCSYCSRCSRLEGVKDKKGDVGEFTPPPVPTIEGIHGKVLAAATATPEALDMGDWHTCNTTHCRAGWVVHLAGDAGYALERFHNTALAAQLIYRASSPTLPVSPPRFYETNETALADMKRMAELEAEQST